MPLKVTDFGSDRKPVSDLLLVNACNLAPFLSYCGVYARWSYYHFDSGCLYSASSFGVNPWNLHCEIWPQKAGNITLR